LLKAEFLAGSAQRIASRFSLPDQFSLIETMLWSGGYPLLEFHLDRLMDSAEYFGFPCVRDEVRAALAAHSHGFAASERRKVRLLLDHQGTFQIGSEALAPGSAEQHSGCVRISEMRTDPTDRYLYHKTTKRPLYASAYKEAARAGYDDVLFLNLRGEVTEGAISNLLIEKNGRWLTPPLECGLLPGVYRRHLLESRPEIEERIMALDDLRCADAVYLANAVRGLRKVRIDWAHS
jgi:para-aminobenzoate synthetase/4-amino-4-deoxychorismate lyase